MRRTIPVAFIYQHPPFLCLMHLVFAWSGVLCEPRRISHGTGRKWKTLKFFCQKIRRFLAIMHKSGE
jgi:hypothetical protein